MVRDLCIARATQRVKGLADLGVAHPGKATGHGHCNLGSEHRYVNLGHSAVGGANLIESTTASQSASIHRSVIARCW